LFLKFSIDIKEGYEKFDIFECVKGKVGDGSSGMINPEWGFGGKSLTLIMFSFGPTFETMPGRMFIGVNDHLMAVKDVQLQRIPTFECQVGCFVACGCG
jgi:hypothetical protein